MKKFKFNKEDNLWYIDLSDYEHSFSKQELLMVAGADKLLSNLADGKDSVTLLVSEEEPTEEGFEKLKWLMNTLLTGGALYTGNFFLPIWLCDVTKFLYSGKMPKVLYYKVTE